MCQGPLKYPQNDPSNCPWLIWVHFQKKILGKGLPPTLIWTTSKSTATFFREAFPDLVSMKVSCVFLLTTVTPTLLTSPYSLLPILTLLENIDSGSSIKSLTTACLFFYYWQVSHVTLVMWIVYPMQLANVDGPVFIKSIFSSRFRFRMVVY